MTFRKSQTLVRLLPLSLAAVAVACSGPQNKAQNPNPTAESERLPQQAKGGLVIPAGAFPSPQGNGEYRLPGGELVASQVIGGEVFVHVAGAVTEASFRTLLEEAAARRLSENDRTSLLGATLSASVKTIQSEAKLTGVSLRPDVGYFSAWLRVSDFDALSRVGELPAGVVLNPVVLEQSKLPELSKSLENKLADGRLDTAGFSGLTRIGVEEFTQQVAAEIGVEPTGSSVVVGVTDTGITLNHPSFNDANGESRIVYMKEFTGEGTAYFSPLARFEVTIPAEGDIPDGVDPSEVLKLTADYLTAPIGLGTRPAGDSFNSLENKTILVNAELRNILTSTNSGARLGVVSEEAFATARDKADINKNGTTNDPIWVIMIPGQDAASHDLHVDLSGTGDFRNAQVVSDWNSTKETVTSFAEKFGFDVGTTDLPLSSGESITAVRAGLVGFDPGNHGSHVAGIIAGRKTIDNDSDDTLARGVAPEAKIAMNRVCANNGGCTSTEAFIDLAQNGADLINMSLGGLSAFNDGFDVQSLMINRVIQLYNAQFLISAGNSGPGHNTVGSPSVARLSLSIGATASREMIERQRQWPGFGKDSDPEVTSDDFMLFFSSRGPTAAGGFKPSISAPGTQLSAIQLNAAAGSRSGLDVYWGTSMAAPTAAGAYALLLDAVRKYNEVNPATPLPEDALVLRRVLMESARPFDVKSFDPQTGETTEGQYTWIDQGAGMVNLPAAWALLKQEQQTALKPSFEIPKIPGDLESGTQPVSLDYQVRVFQTNPKGGAYDGSLPALAPIGLDPNQTVVAPRLGTGIWLDADATDSLVEVQLARRLSEKLLSRSDAGELHRQLVTTADEFVLETEVFGSSINWLSAGTLNALDCSTSEVVPKVTIVGEGAVDVPGQDLSNPGSSAGLLASNLYVCMNRSAMQALPAGDHGALIKAYRTVDGVRENTPSFIVPVYMTVPHQKLADAQRFEASGIVKSFQVSRNYVNVPEGTSLIRVSLTVPEANLENGVVTGCSGVRLYALEADNTTQPPEFANPEASIARSCTETGAPEDFVEARTVQFERTNPNPGIWDLHVFGRYAFASSAYTMTVDYANLTSDVTEISGTAEVLNGSFNLQVGSSSFEIAPSMEQSSYELNGLAQELTAEVGQKEFSQVPNLDGVVFRQYGEDVSAVVFETYGAPESDIDLQVLECADATTNNCATVAASGTATDVERAAFTPNPEAFYVAIVHGYEVPGGTTEYNLKETQYLNESATGSLTIDGASQTGFAVTYSLDAAQASLLQRPEFLSGAYRVVGALKIGSSAGTLLSNIPVSIESEPSAQ